MTPVLVTLTGCPTNMTCSAWVYPSMIGVARDTCGGNASPCRGTGKASTSPHRLAASGHFSPNPNTNTENDGDSSQKTVWRLLTEDSVLIDSAPLIFTTHQVVTQREKGTSRVKRPCCLCFDPCPGAKGKGLPSSRPAHGLDTLCADQQSKCPGPCFCCGGSTCNTPVMELPILEWLLGTTWGRVLCDVDGPLNRTTVLK